MEPKHQSLQKALLDDPNYSRIPHDRRAACARFLTLRQNANVSPAEVESSYEEALAQARELASEGELTIAIPAGIRDPEQPTRQPASEGPEYPVHPAAALFPMMRDNELNELAEDIRTNGLQMPIVIHQRQLLDGRNRLEACKRAGARPTFVEWSGTGSVLGWILSVNLHRRHLTDSQRAMVAGVVAREMESEAKERSAHNLRNCTSPVEGLDSAPRGEGKSAQRAATLLNVSPDKVKKAAKLLKHADASVVSAVKKGAVSLDAAAQIVGLSKDKQRKLVEDGTVKEAAKRVREGKAASRPQTEPGYTSDGKSRSTASGSVKTDTEPAARASAESPTATKSSSSLPPPGAELLRIVAEAHQAIDEMVRTARGTHRASTLKPNLEAIVRHCKKVMAKFPEKVRA